jgi:hypothetical protein
LVGVLGVLQFGIPGFLSINESAEPRPPRPPRGSGGTDGVPSHL